MPASQGDRPITIQVTVQQIVINSTDQASAQQAATQLQSEILTAMEDPRFQIAVRETLRATWWSGCGKRLMRFCKMFQNQSPNASGFAAAPTLRISTR